MSFKIRFAKETLLVVRMDLLVEAVWPTFSQLSQGHCDILMACFAQRFFISIIALTDQ